MADWQPPAADFTRKPVWQPPASDFASGGTQASAVRQSSQSPAEGLLARIRDAFSGTHGLFGPDYLKGSAEGLKQMGRTIGASLNPFAEQRESARAGGEIAGSVLEGAGALAAGEMGERPSQLVPKAGGSAASRLLQDMRTSQVTPSIPAVGGGRASGLVSQGLRTLPLSPVGRGITRNIGEAGAQSERIAGQYGGAENAEQAGNVARNAMRRFGEDTTQADKDYGAYYRIMHGTPPAAVSRTVNLLQDLNKKFPSAPGLARLVNHPKIASYLAELEPRTTTIPAKTSSVLGPTGTPIVTAPARIITSGGTLTNTELRNLRSSIGEQIGQPEFNRGKDDIPKKELRRLYSALSEDMMAAARARGPKAVQALTKANSNFNVRMQIIDKLDKLFQPGSQTIGAEAFANKLGRFAGTASGNIGALEDAKKVMTPEEWGDVAAATVRKMGEPSAGQARMGPFSVAGFSTNYAKISDKAKDLLFGPDVPGSPRASLEALNRTTGALANVASLANTSHSAEMLAVAHIAEGVIGAIAAGKAPISTALGIGGAYGMAKLLMSPRLAEWLYQMPTIVRGAPNPAVATARAMTALEGLLAGPPIQGPQRPPPLPEQHTDARDYIKGRTAGDRPQGPVRLPSGQVVGPPQ